MHIKLHPSTYCCLVIPSSGTCITSWIFVNIGLGNDLLPDGIKPLPEPMLINHRWERVPFAWGHVKNLLLLPRIVTDVSELWRVIYGYPRVIYECLRLTTIWRSVKNRKKNMWTLYNRDYLKQKLFKAELSDYIHIRQWDAIIHSFMLWLQRRDLLNHQTGWCWVINE